MPKPERIVQINRDQRLFVIPYGSGYSCLGFDVCERRTRALEKELNELYPLKTEKHRKGTLAAYEYYQKLIRAARDWFEKSGHRFQCELTPQLVGLEGKRVEVVDKYGERRRFKVGKSTGWIPCHLELANSRSSGGGAVTGAPFKSVRIIR